MNGSFETSPLVTNGPNWAVYSSILGWSSSNGIEVQRDNVAGLASDGRNLVELDTHGVNSNTAIWQDVATVVGHTYAWSFDYSARPGTSKETNLFKYSINGEVFPKAGFPGVSTTNWGTFSDQFVADKTTAQLKFWAVGTDDTLGS